MIVLSRADWDRMLYKSIFHIYVPAVRACMQLLSGTAVAAFALALRLLCASLMFGVHPLEYEHRKQVSGASLGTRCVWHWPSAYLFPSCGERRGDEHRNSDRLGERRDRGQSSVYICFLHAANAVAMNTEIQRGPGSEEDKA